MEDVPQPAGFVLSFDALRHTDVLLPDGSGKCDREAKAGLRRRGSHVNEYAVLDGLSCWAKSARAMARR